MNASISCDSASSRSVYFLLGFTLALIFLWFCRKEIYKIPKMFFLLAIWLFRVHKSPTPANLSVWIAFTCWSIVYLHYETVHKSDHLEEDNAYSIICVFNRACLIRWLIITSDHEQLVVYYVNCLQKRSNDWYRGTYDWVNKFDATGKSAQ